MLVILRILFGVALLCGFYQVRENAQSNPEAGDLMNAFYLGVCVIVGILNAVVWAPYFGARISEPLTGTFTNGPGFDPKNRWVRLILGIERHGHRRLTLWLCFLEGVRHPKRPAAFVIGLRNAKAGTWWERIYARELFTFDNAQNCLHAYQALKRQGIDPGIHPNQEVNLLLRSVHKPVKAEPEKLDVPRAPQMMPVRRNRQIQLFQMDESPKSPRPGVRVGGEDVGPKDDPAAVSEAHPVKAASSQPVNPSVPPHP